MAFVTDQIKEAFTTDANGNVALRTTLDGQEANWLTATPFYRLDGSNDGMTIADSATITNIFANGGSVGAWIYPKSHSGDIGYIVYKWATNKGWIFNIDTESGGFVSLRLRREGTTDGIWETGSVVPLNAWSFVAVTYDDSSPGTAPVFYLNGVAIAVSSATACVAPISDTGESMKVGLDISGAGAFDGQIAGWGLANRAITAAEAAAIYASGPDGLESALGWSAIGGSQATVVTNGTFDADTDWTKGAAWDINTTTAGKAHYAATGSNSLRQNDILTIGKRYRITFDISGAAGTAAVGVTDGTTGLGIVVSGDGSYSKEFTATDNDILFYAETADGAFDLDNVSIVPIGIVANYPPKAFSAATAFDVSGNGLSGAVTGATLHQKEAVAESGGFPVFSVTSGITADTGSAQGGGVLTTAINQIATCGTAGDAVTLPAAKPGRKVWVYNDGAESADVFPASGDNIDEAGANTAKALAADANAEFTCTSAGHWSTIVSA